ncbi:hypothetical protein COCSUDRAFT_33051 [Coccomyxa subellipsoidea C-169]|uniref:Uncharacterized protein n=1 Tax=Coccomyxa subellipsoidea (strain C-169) TaxID=574566 RepID=I0YY80_COCSC|nr:hypothetical protein COCSUDRAFT_33051 [Coccomyxa subellipsoidea C-169]EIE23349.1 hypothetical protein COCSUDRAFT_33051 [Coccomyxa subellipsoidea C-169]|eukprot:XP_005647893.1 hypothetical protein COCSUDRAFT_33051 [Coccomyxa subellipsoidea C-169]
MSTSEFSPPSGSFKGWSVCFWHPPREGRRKVISSESQDQVSGQVVIAVRRVMPLKCTRLQVSPEASAQATVNFYSIGWFLSLPSCTWGSGEWIFALLPACGCSTFAMCFFSEGHY